MRVLRGDHTYLENGESMTLRESIFFLVGMALGRLFELSMTTEPKTYTPGPWRAVDRGAHWNNPSITNWEIHWSEDGECVVDHVYEEADANLIAAAPDLIEALKSALAFVEFYNHRYDGQDGLHPHGIVTAARAAIAKAEGR